jgi:hypothetical protein
MAGSMRLPHPIYAYSMYYSAHVRLGPDPVRPTTDGQIARALRVPGTHSSVSGPALSAASGALATASF